MDDFYDPDEIEDPDNHDNYDLDSSNDENIDLEADQPLEDSSINYGEEIPPESEADNPAIEIGLEDLNTLTDYDKVLAPPEEVTDSETGYAELYGDPDSDAEVWHQQTYPDTCAVVCQEFILETYLERDFSEDELALEAISNGYYIPGMGTFPDQVGNLLEDYDIEVERSDGNTIEDLADKLSNNQKIIVGVDANEIWAPSGEEQLKDLLFMPEANHAVMVTGYDDSTQIVYLNDPGHPDGKAMSVSRDDFENAWNDSSNFMVNTVNAPPSA